MTISGEGMERTIIDGSSSSQIFKVNNGVIFNLKNLAISHGKAGFGGGLLNLGTVNIEGCKFSDCYTSYVAYGGGAAICNADGGILNVLDSFFLNNNAKLSSAGGGGAVMTNGTTTLRSCTFKGNSGYCGGVLYSSNVANIEVKGCSFTQNTATNSAGVMFFKTMDSTINIHYSSFSGNTAMSGKPAVIDNGFNNLLNVDSNWWGTNSGPVSGEIRGSYSVTRWLYMKFDVSPTKIKSGKTSTATVNFNHLFDGTTVTDIDPTQGCIPEGTSVNYITDIGSINPAINGTVKGIATAIYTASTVGLATLNATCDNTTFTKNITIDPLLTTIIIDSISNFPGQTTTITVHLTDENNNTVNDGTSNITIFGQSYNVIVINGIATLTLPIPIDTTPGTYDILTKYDGTGTIYANSTTTARLNVTKTPTITSVESAQGESGDTITITAQLKDHYNNPVVGATVKFNINSGTLIEGLTDENGIVKINYTIKENPGNYSFTATYNGNDTLLGSSQTGTLTVNKISANIFVKDLNGKYGETVPLLAFLKDKNGNVISGKKINFYINNTNIGSATTDRTGAAPFIYQIDRNIGEYTIKTSLTGDSLYQDTEGTGTLTVNPIPTGLTTINSQGKYGETVQFNAILKDENNNPIPNQNITFKINDKTIGTAITDNTGTAIFTYLLGKSGDFTIHGYYDGNNIYSGTSNYGKLNVTPWAQLYIYTKTTNKSPKVGDTFKITYKLSNKGLDIAYNVRTTIKIPKGLEFVKLTGYDGICVFDQLTQTLTWTLNTLNMGDSSSLELVLKAVDNGTYIIEPQTTANTTIDMMTNSSLIINVQKESHNNTNKTDNNTNIPDTGIPIFLLIIGILMVIGGILVKK